MKTKWLWTLLMLVSATASAQITFNAKAGANLSGFTGVGSGGESEMKVRYQVGVGMEYAFTKLWSVQTSLLFIKKGADTSVGILGTVESVDEYAYKEINEARTTYLEMPVMAAVRLPLAKNMNIVIKAGPYIAYGIDGSIDGEQELHYHIKAGDDPIFGTIPNDRKSQYKGEFFNSYFAGNKFDAGIAMGVAYEFGSLFIDLTGEWGLTKLYGSHTIVGKGMPAYTDVNGYHHEEITLNLYKDKSPRNVTIAISLGYKF